MGMPKYDRLLYILNLLRSRKNLNAASLAVECGVTERSIYRDIIALSEANIPIYYDNGYKLATDNFLPPLNFNTDEFRCLKLVLESSPLNKQAEYADTIKKISAKIDAIASEQVRKDYKFNDKSTFINIYSSDKYYLDSEFYFRDLEKAINESRQIKIIYDAIESGMNERIVDPYFIIFRGSSFYLVGYCHLRNEFRTFRFNRVKSITNLDSVFIKQDDVNAESYFKNKWLLFAGETVEVELIFRGTAAKIINTGEHHPHEIIQELDNNRISYKVEVEGVDEIQRWIATFGSDVEVINPPEIRSNLQRIGDYYINKYR